MAETSLPDAELDVLGALREKGKATARELREALEHSRPMAHGSVVTLLKRLEAKSLVKKERGPVGKAFVYRPTRRARTACRGVLERLVKRLYGGSGVALVASLFETNPPRAEEIEDLQRLLDQLRKENHRT
jgi:predicted transcriptional regulator